MSEKVLVPDVGEADNIEVVELLVSVGDTVAKDDSLVVLESDKASMEIPSPFAGVITAIRVKVGDTVDEGDLILELDVESPVVTETGKTDELKNEQAQPGAKPTGDSLAPDNNRDVEMTESVPPSVIEATSSTDKVHAGPAVRKQAREYGVQLSGIDGSGKYGRILKEDVQRYVKQQMSSAGRSAAGGIPEIPVVDFSKFGETEIQPLSRIRRASAKNLHRSWLNVPHVTQFDEADITEMEVFRNNQNQELAADGIKVTPLAFLVKAVVTTLIKFPQFNSSISPDYEHLVLKKYFNIGVAVETPDGLVVPVIKAADKKGIIHLAQEASELAAKARDRKLPIDAMQGATFTISSLGGIGGTAFTPIVNAPEVAILGVSRSKVIPVYDGKEFLPRTMLPLSLSYDHRAIDGAEAARFTTYLVKVLSDLRRILM